MVANLMALVPLLDLRPSDPPDQALHAPANIEAEQALLGVLLYDNSAYERLSDSLQASDFFEPFHGRLFDAIQAHVRRGQLAEPILMNDQFQRDPAFQELGGMRYLASLVAQTPGHSKMIAVVVETHARGRLFGAHRHEKLEL